MKDQKRPPPATWGELFRRVNEALPEGASCSLVGRKITIKLPDDFPDPQLQREARRAVLERLLQDA